VIWRASAPCLYVTTNEMSAPPIFVPITSKKPRCILTMPLAASAAKRRMDARDEWMIHVKIAAKAMAMMGSLFSGAIISGKVADVLRGIVASRTRASDRSIRPRPIRIKNRCFFLPPFSYFIWPIMPIVSSAGESQLRSKVRICATMVVAISAPMTKAIAAPSGMLCFLTKDSMRRVAAVELCNKAVVPKPEMAEATRFLVPRDTKSRREEP